MDHFFRHLDTTGSLILFWWVAAISLGGCSFLQEYHTLSEKPERAGTPATFEPRPSSIELAIHIPYSVLSSAADSAADRFAVSVSHERHNLYRQNVHAPITGGLVFRAEVNADLDYNISRAGPIEFGRNDAQPNTVAVSIPVQFAGGAGLSGDFARMLSLNRKNFDGAFRVGASTGFVVDGSFCPTVDRPTARFEWIRGATVELMGRSCANIPMVNINLCAGPSNFPIGDLVTRRINQNLSAQLQEIGATIPCGAIRDELARAWKHYSIPVRFKDTPPLYVNVTPVALGIPGVRTDDAGVVLAGWLQARVSVGTEAGPNGPITPMPANLPVAAAPGRISLAMPLFAPYRVLEDTARALIVGQPFRTDTDLGTFTLTPNGIEVYPNKDRLVFGVAFDLQQPRRILRTSGKIWFTAKPVPSPDGRQLRLAELAISRQVDNPLWSVVSAIVIDQVLKRYADGYVVDLSSLLDEALVRIQEDFTAGARNNGLSARLDNASLRLGRIVPASEHLVVEGLFDAGLRATLSEVRL